MEILDKSILSKNVWLLYGNLGNPRRLVPLPLAEYDSDLTVSVPDPH
jgi:hypothetical protein